MPKKGWLLSLIIIMLNVILDIGERRIIQEQVDPVMYDITTSIIFLLDAFYHPVLSAATVFCITVIVGGIFRFAERLAEREQTIFNTYQIRQNKLMLLFRLRDGGFSTQDFWLWNSNKHKKFAKYHVKHHKLRTYVDKYIY